MPALRARESPPINIATSLLNRPSHGSIRTRRSAVHSPNPLLRELDLVHQAPRIAPPPNPQWALTRLRARLPWMESAHLSLRWSLPAPASLLLSPETNPLFLYLRESSLPFRPTPAPNPPSRAPLPPPEFRAQTDTAALRFARAPRASSSPPSSGPAPAPVNPTPSSIRLCCAATAVGPSIDEHPPNPPVPRWFSLSQIHFASPSSRRVRRSAVRQSLAALARRCSKAPCSSYSRMLRRCIHASAGQSTPQSRRSPAVEWRPVASSSFELTHDDFGRKQNVSFERAGCTRIDF